MGAGVGVGGRREEEATGCARVAMLSGGLCLRGDDGDTWSSKVTFTKPKGSKTQAPLTKAEEDALKLITNRESTLGIFHSVGKVVVECRMIQSRIIASDAVVLLD